MAPVSSPCSTFSRLASTGIITICVRSCELLLAVSNTCTHTWRGGSYFVGDRWAVSIFGIENNWENAEN